jgi:hypothetical protein
MPLTVPKRIYDFLHSNSEKDFCDNCIANKVPRSSEGSINRHQAQQATMAFEVTREFERSQRECSVCSKVKKVIRAKCFQTGPISNSHPLSRYRSFFADHPTSFYCNLDKCRPANTPTRRSDRASFSCHSCC